MTAPGLFMKYLRRGSGYYIDVGASQLIIDGRVKLANGQVSKITGNAVVMANGTDWMPTSLFTPPAMAR